MIPESITCILDNVRKVIVGKDELIELAVMGLLCEGHILIEDVPGIGKTTIAKTLARSVGGSFHRIQCTPDLLPSDVTGLYYYDQKKCEFEFRPGPVNSNVVLVDEINRATPRTQSALLECMEERQVTVEGVTMPLPRPFLVIATQNPVELHGTFPLPEAQLDRFLLKLEVGYPSEDHEYDMMLRFEKDSPLENLGQVTSPVEILKLKAQAQSIFIEESVRRYILAIMRQTRNNPALSLGASPRASLALVKAAQTYAMMQGRDYVLPDDIKYLVVPVLAHRLMLNTEAYLSKTSKESILENILASIPVPLEA